MEWAIKVGSLYVLPGIKHPLEVTVDTGNWVLDGDEYKFTINHNFGKTILPSLTVRTATGERAIIGRVIKIDNNTMECRIPASPDNREDGLIFRLSPN